jgi:hypothetical protein
MIIVQPDYGLGPLTAIERQLIEDHGETPGIVGRRVSGLHWSSEQVTPARVTDTPELNNQWVGDPTSSGYIDEQTAGGVVLTTKTFSKPGSSLWRSSFVTDVRTGEVYTFPPDGDATDYYVTAASLSADGTYIAITYTGSNGDRYFAVYEVATQQIVAEAPYYFSGGDAEEDDWEFPTFAFFAKAGSYLYVQHYSEEGEYYTVVYDSADGFSVVATLEGAYWFATDAYAIRRGITDLFGVDTLLVSVGDWLEVANFGDGAITVLDISLDGKYVTWVRGRVTVDEHPTSSTWLQVYDIAAEQVVFEYDPYYLRSPSVLEQQSIQAVFSPDSTKLVITLGPIVRSSITFEFLPYIIGEGSTVIVDVSSWMVTSTAPSSSVSSGYLDVDIEDVVDNIPRPFMSVFTPGDSLDAEVTLEVEGSGHSWSTSLGYTLTPVPVYGEGNTWSVGEGVTMSIDVSGSGHTWSVCVATLSQLVPVTGAGYTWSAGEGWVFQPIPVTGDGFTWSVASGVGEVLGDADILDHLVVDDAPEYILARHVLELLHVVDTLKPISHTWDDLADALRTMDNLLAYFSEAINAALEAGDGTVPYRFIRVVEALLASEEGIGYYRAAAVAVVTLAALDEAGIGTVEELVSELENSDELRLAISGLITDLAQVTDVATGAMRIFVNEDAALVVGDEAGAIAALRVAIEEGLCPVVSYSFDGSTYVGYVVNTEGANPITKYTNFPFNSFTQFAGRNIVAGEGGLYELGAESDDGQPIAASFKTMMIDFGSSVMKRVQTAYIGYTATGRLILRVHAVTDGKLREHWFEATPRTADAPRQHVRQLGRGLASRYWQFELVNVDGADFDVDKIEFHVIALSRRA